MKINLVSDLHLEFMNDSEIDLLVKNICSTQADALVLAGDICTYNRPQKYRDFLNTLAAEGLYRKIFVVPGNHEYYGSTLDTEPPTGIDPIVTFLNKGTFVLDDVVFIGCTLWTDFNKNNPIDVLNSRHMNDYNFISQSKQNLRDITPSLIYDLHKSELAWLDETLDQWADNELADWKRVVITHHGPTVQSIHPKYNLSGLNYSFTSDLKDFVLKHQPELWLQGHTHCSISYRVKETQVHVNPKGYGNENPDFLHNYLLVI
jgi:predicted MPP superfamily phosphohydrolase